MTNNEVNSLINVLLREMSLFYNMPKHSILIACQAFLCCIEAYLVSKISLVGKVGIALFYKEYGLLRSGWKTFLLFFLVQLALVLLLAYAEKKLPVKKLKLLISALFFTGLIGLWGTFYDFQYTFAHRILKERFHLGFYLFWIGWMSTCVYFLMIIRGRKTTEMLTDETIHPQE